MKKVIPSAAPTDTILLEEVLKKPFPLVGFLTARARKVTLVPAKYESDLYFARCVDAWGKGNGFDPYGQDKQTVAQWEEFFRKNHKAEMFVFDSPQELFKWLAE